MKAAELRPSWEVYGLHRRDRRESAAKRFCSEPRSLATRCKRPSLFRVDSGMRWHAPRPGTGRQKVFRPGPEHRGTIKAPSARMVGFQDFENVPCGKCKGCARRKANSWVLRLMAEAQTARHAIVLTLTYAGDGTPGMPKGWRADGHEREIHYRDFQLFMKRLRKRYAKLGATVRYFVAGEYGSRKGRAHFHVILYFVGGAPELVSVVDREFPESKDKNDNFHHATWWDVQRDVPMGHINRLAGSFGTGKAFYVAKYIVKGMTGECEAVWKSSFTLGRDYVSQIAERDARYGTWSKGYARMPGLVENKNWQVPMMGSLRGHYVREVMRFSYEMGKEPDFRELPVGIERTVDRIVKKERQKAFDRQELEEVRNESVETFAEELAQRRERVKRASWRWQFKRAVAERRTARRLLLEIERDLRSAPPGLALHDWARGHEPVARRRLVAAINMLEALLDECKRAGRNDIWFSRQAYAPVEAGLDDG